MFSKINVYKIFVDHLQTLKKFNSDTLSTGDIVLFFVFPFVIALILALNGICVDETIRNVLITALSIFTALLFNLLLLIFDIIRKNDKDKDENSLIKTKFLKEIYSNISFCILIAILDILILILTFVKNDYVKSISNFLNFYILIIFILTMFMVLKRVHSLLSKES